MSNNHSFHLVEKSPWPIMSGIVVMSMMMSTVMLFNNFNNKFMILATINMLMIMYQWWRDINRESAFQGLHTKTVITGMKWGMILFISSEVMFFLSFFWAYFHSSLTPSIEIGMIWPPTGVKTFNPMEIPLLNTLILVSSGISVTWCHHSLMSNNLKQAMMSLTITVILGIYFTVLQGFEYMESPFTISDSVYGSCFFMTTGFHGLHVIIGTTFLLTTLLQLYLNFFTSNHHLGFEAAAWYWHFVDVVWLLLYLSIYWWGK